MMKETIIREILHDVAGLLDSRQLDELRSVLETRLKSVDMTESTEATEKNKQDNYSINRIDICAVKIVQTSTFQQDIFYIPVLGTQLVE